ncbi:squalene/phytoene synthase family protein [Bradyrhizobium lablabi]|uniref:phytoene/squalene synthase family protein n=1 Tax=Bradyrhizobium lablabi TaxID=722472 RepID=UPI001BA6CE31|nr:phytoene/squalene synthase family protein [Bradyrhizobium lablabi]MBR1120796.1 squalene/phytoene synthase family protein [Bradyrhizobium lablabi]
MSEVQSPEEAAAFCADLVRTHDFPRYASTLFLPSVHRRPLLALYAFNVEISRVREVVTQPLPGEIRLRWWSDLLLGEDHGGIEGSPVAAELLWAVRTWRLPIDRLVRLVEEHEFDLYNDPMPSLSALEGYANDTASALFACGTRFLLRPSAEIDHVARHAGLAYGLTQVISALPIDTARRQLFVPLQLLEQNGSGQHEVFAGKQTPGMRVAIDQLIDEAKKHLDTALRLLAEVPADVRPAFLPLALARRDLKRMSRADYDPFVPRRTPRLRLLWTLWRASRSPEFRGGD